MTGEDMNELQENVKRVMDKVAKAAAGSGREPEEVLLLAASKMNGPERVVQAKEAGIRAFGENRVQEMEEKLRAGAYDGAQLHFIGHLQRNKVRELVGRVDLIQSVDSQELIEMIGARAVRMGLEQSVLIEVNIGGEESKSGVEPERLGDILDIAGKTEGILVKGLMTIPPISVDISQTRRYFDQMFKLFVDMRAKKYDNITMQFLSMGMSADFEEAIRCGANIVRVGTAIFGARHYS